MDENHGNTCNATLTESGKWKVQQEELRVQLMRNEISQKKVQAEETLSLIPGTDYIVKNEGGENWVAFQESPNTADIRHEWILVRRHRPMAPHFKGRDFIYNIYRTDIYIYIYLKSNIYCFVFITHSGHSSVLAQSVPLCL